MKKTKIFLISFFIGALAAGGPVLFVSRLIHNQRLELQRGAIGADIADFNRLAYKVERSVVDNVPIYSDYANSALEKKLRSYLYPYHIRIASKFADSVKDLDQAQKLIETGKLVPVEESSWYYFYGVKKEHRYLVPTALKALDIVAERFNSNLKSRGVDVTVKLAVSSLLRPAVYQKELTGKNSNAVDESTHSFGVSFDLFFDDYYVVLIEGSTGVSGDIINEIRPRYGFMLGDSLRRQFKAILAETMLELQDEGLVYVIMEFKQRVFHVTFTENLHSEK
ncbi:MAG: hypothetical protein JXK07_00685 [Spirochaetes bacterium]|nr:hypothetical protein [Spirochaetota bacterium]MBN2770707.1 hypothetical protein [Spirochaetota bacterium]